MLDYLADNGQDEPSYLVSIMKKSFHLKCQHGIQRLNSRQVAGLGEKPSDLYSKTCVKQPLKKDKTKVLMTTGSLQYF